MYFDIQKKVCSHGLRMQYLSFLIPTWMILECFKAVVWKGVVWGGKEAEGLDVGRNDLGKVLKQELRQRY